MCLYQCFMRSSPLKGIYRKNQGSLVTSQFYRPGASWSLKTSMAYHCQAQGWWQTQTRLWTAWPERALLIQRPSILAALIRVKRGTEKQWSQRVTLGHSSASTTRESISTAWALLMCPSPAQPESETMAVGPGKSGQEASHCFKKWDTEASPPDPDLIGLAWLWCVFKGGSDEQFGKLRNPGFCTVALFGHPVDYLLEFKDLSQCWITGHLPVGVPWWRAFRRWCFLLMGQSWVDHFFSISSQSEWLAIILKSVSTWGALTTSHTPDPAPREPLLLVWV